MERGGTDRGSRKRKEEGVWRKRWPGINSKKQVGQRTAKICITLHSKTVSVLQEKSSNLHSTWKREVSNFSIMKKQWGNFSSVLPGAAQRAEGHSGRPASPLWLQGKVFPTYRPQDRQRKQEHLLQLCRHLHFSFNRKLYPHNEIVTFLFKKLREERERRQWNPPSSSPTITTIHWAPKVPSHTLHRHQHV